MTDIRQEDHTAPVITIDGPSGTGKGTIARLIADQLGWHLLDSGALYRLLALAVVNHAVDFTDIQTITAMAEQLDVEFNPGSEVDMETTILLEGRPVGEAIRTEEMGNNASMVAAIPAVRDALKSRQLAFRQQPGLVADGRDMGTVIFPHAELKLFLTASAEERAKRRYKQLIEKGLNVNIPALSREIDERDKRDASRAVAPLVAADDAIIIDTSTIGIAEVIDRISPLLAARALT